MRKTFIVGFMAVFPSAAAWLWHERSHNISPKFEPAFKVGTPAVPKQPSDTCSEVEEIKTLTAVVPRSHRVKAFRSATALGPDELIIYDAVLKHWMSDGRRTLNVSKTTFPLDPTDSRSGLAECSCLQGIHMVEASPFRSYHRLTSTMLPQGNIRLVAPDEQIEKAKNTDPEVGIANGKSANEAVKDAFESGLFSLSEIAFDKHHNYAVVSYKFWCGLLCGSGSTLVFEKVGNEWKKTARQCGGWIS